MTSAANSAVGTAAEPVIARTTTRRWLLALSATFLLALPACDKKPPVEAAATFDHIAPSPVGTSQTVLEKTFAVKKTQTFTFQIPAHAVRPHLHGIFQSFLKDVHGASDDSAAVDFLIVNEEQYADMSSNRPSEALMSVEASHNQAVNLDLPASLDQPVKYFLVFRNTAAGSSKIVEASFRVDF